MEVVGIIAVIAVVTIIYFLISHGVNKAGNALERAVRPGAAANEDELLSTVVTFHAHAPLETIRTAISQNVSVKGNLWTGRMTVNHDSERGIVWEIGAVSAGAGFIAQLSYTVDNGVTIGEYSISKHSTGGGVSPFISKMTELRNEVITAFQAADSSVAIETGKQDVTRKTSWF